MKIIHLIRMAVALGFVFAGGVWAENQPQSVHSPNVYFPSDHYDFGSVVEGTEVRHAFVIQNKGNAPLEIIKVETT